MAALVTVSGIAMLLLLSVSGYRSGAPQEACDTMTPSHGVSPSQIDTFRYAVSTKPHTDGSFSSTCLIHEMMSGELLTFSYSCLFGF